MCSARNTIDRNAKFLNSGWAQEMLVRQKQCKAKQWLAIKWANYEEVTQRTTYGALYQN